MPYRCVAEEICLPETDPNTFNSGSLFFDFNSNMYLFQYTFWKAKGRKPYVLVDQDWARRIDMETTCGFSPAV